MFKKEKMSILAQSGEGTKSECLTWQWWVSGTEHPDGEDMEHMCLSGEASLPLLREAAWGLLSDNLISVPQSHRISPLNIYVDSTYPLNNISIYLRIKLLCEHRNTNPNQGGTRKEISLIREAWCLMLQFPDFKWNWGGQLWAASHRLSLPRSWRLKKLALVYTREEVA